MLCDDGDRPQTIANRARWPAGSAKSHDGDATPLVNALRDATGRARSCREGKWRIWAGSGD